MTDRYAFSEEVPILRVQISGKYGPAPSLQWWYSRDGMSFRTAKVYLSSASCNLSDDAKVHALPRNGDWDELKKISWWLRPCYGQCPDVHHPFANTLTVHATADHYRKIVQERFQDSRRLVEHLVNTISFPFDIALIARNYLGFEPIHASIYIGGGN